MNKFNKINFFLHFINIKHRLYFLKLHITLDHEKDCYHGKVTTKTLYSDYKPPKMVNMEVIKTISVSQSFQPYSPMVFQRRSFLKSHISPLKGILLSARIIQQIEPIRTPLNS